MNFAVLHVLQLLFPVIEAQLGPVVPSTVEHRWSRVHRDLEIPGALDNYKGGARCQGNWPLVHEQSGLRVIRALACREARSCKRTTKFSDARVDAPPHVP